MCHVDKMWMLRQQLKELSDRKNGSLLILSDVLESCPNKPEDQLPYLIIKSCEVLHALQGSIVNYSKTRAHREIC